MDVCGMCCGFGLVDEFRRLFLFYLWVFIGVPAIFNLIFIMFFLVSLGTKPDVMQIYLDG